MKLLATAGTALGAAVISLTLMGSPALAANPCAMNPCAEKMMNPCGKMMNPCAVKERRAKHHAMKKEHMGMMREVMVILRDLNHKPTKEQKKRLTHYIEKLDANMATCDTWDKDGAHHMKKRNK
jgi:hypothetical protein